MKLYSCSAVQDLISHYIDAGGDVLEIEPGTLGYGLTICVGENLKTFIIQETYINEWSSGHKIRGYNETPKKYQQMIDKYYNRT